MDDRVCELITLNTIMITKEQLQERAQLVRVWEASCQIQYPTAQESNFRIAVAKKLGQEFGLRELRTLTITGPVSEPVGRPGQPANGRK